LTYDFRVTFYFYDLETTGFNSREGRIMQFAGQRTDSQLEPVGDPDNFLIKISEDIVPDPDAVLITGITPQKTISEGITEAEFCRYFDTKINQAGTIFVGFNSIRFDDEFMRHLFYRNFYDSYEWHWQDDNSRWDLLDVVRMTRALRPEGIQWPFASDGAPSNKLGDLTSVNKLDHINAHDALSDVNATIAMARLIKTKQPDLFDYLLKIRKKDEVSSLVLKSQQFVYTSGKYPSQFEKTTVVATVAKTARGDGAVVYDLRYDPTDFFDLSPQELAKAWYRRDIEEGIILPVKTLKFNKCPAVAPIGTLFKDKASQQRLQIDPSVIEENYKKLKAAKDWPNQLLKAQELLDKQLQDRLLPDEQDVDNQLYSAFFDKADKQAMRLIRAALPDELSDLGDKLKDNRLQALLPLYKARNYKKYLTPDETKQWEKYRYYRLLSGGQDSRLARYFSRLEELKKTVKSKSAQYLLTELELYGQSVMPEPN
jgi:exodeoxyribonuclease-1